MYALPPPSTTPSSIAARVADKASSILSFFSFNSVCVAAPTSITAIPPNSLASLFLRFFISSSSLCANILFLVSSIFASILEELPFP